MNKNAVLLLALAMVACGRPPDFAVLCAEAVREDGTQVASAIFTVDSNLLFTDCIGVDPTVSHDLWVSKVKGLETPRPKWIPANVLKEDKPNIFKFVYRQDMRQIVVRALNPFSKVIAKAVIRFDGRVLGMGEVTTQYDATVSHTVSFGKVEGLTSPSAIELKVDQYADNFVLEAKYTGSNLAEVCFTTQNIETGAEIGATIEINGNRVEGENPKCAAVDVTKPVRANGASVAGMAGPEFKIAPNVLEVGSTRSFGYPYFSASGEIQYLNVDTTPVLGEVFVVDAQGNRHSFGWPLATEPATIIVKPTNFSKIEFGAVTGHETAKPVVWKQEFLQSNNHEPLVGFYDFSTLGLYCARGEDEWKNGVSLSNTKIDQTVFTKDWSNRFVCEALNPADSHTIVWGTAYDQVAPAPTVIPTKAILAGGRSDSVGKYTQATPYEEDKQIRVKLKNAFGDTQVSSFSVNGVPSRSTEAYWSGKSSKVSTVVFHFEVEPYLLAPPDLTIDTTTLSKSDSRYNSESRQWSWELVLASAAPSAKVCARAENHDGSPLSPQSLFNGLDPANWDEGKDRCRVLPVGQAHLVTFGYNQGYRSPTPLYIAAGRLSAGSTVTYTGTFVLDNRAATVCVGTSGKQGEIFLNSRSVGFAEVLGASQVCVPVDIRKVNAFSFSTENGVTPPPKVFQANDPANPNGPGTLQWNSNTNFLAAY